MSLRDLHIGTAEITTNMVNWSSKDRDPRNDFVESLKTFGLLHIRRGRENKRGDGNSESKVLTFQKYHFLCFRTQNLQRLILGDLSAH